MELSPNVTNVCRLVNDRTASNVDYVMSTAFTPDGRWSLAAFSNGQVMAFEEATLSGGRGNFSSRPVPSSVATGGGNSVYTAVPSAATTTFFPCGELVDIDEALTSVRVVSRQLSFGAAAAAAASPTARDSPSSPAGARGSSTVTAEADGMSGDGAVATKYRVFATTSKGKLHVIDWTPRFSCLPVASAWEHGNEIMTCDVSPDGQTVVTGGSDAVVKVYTLKPPQPLSDSVDDAVEITLTGRAQHLRLISDDDDAFEEDDTSAGGLGNTKGKNGGGEKKAGTVEAHGMTLVRHYEHDIDANGLPSRGHASKVMCVRFATPHQFLSAGWESSVLVFDLRSEQSSAVQVLGGPRIGGDGIDVVDGTYAVTVSQQSSSETSRSPSSRRVSATPAAAAAVRHSGSGAFITSSGGNSGDGHGGGGGPLFTRNVKQLHVFDLQAGVEVEPTTAGAGSCQSAALSGEQTESRSPVVTRVVPATAEATAGGLAPIAPHSPPTRASVTSVNPSGSTTVPKIEFVFPEIEFDFLPFSLRTFGRKSRFGLWCCGKDPHSLAAVDIVTGQQAACVTGFGVPVTSVAVKPGDPGTVIVGGGHNSVWRITAQLSPSM